MYQLLKYKIKNNVKLLLLLISGIGLIVVAYFLILALKTDSFIFLNNNADDAGKGQINISGHAFRDINSNGIYDITDKTMSGVQFQLHLADKQSNRTITNIAGWANFVMSYNNAGASINRPGNYTIIAYPPRGMKITTNNKTQMFNASRLPGSIGGLTLDKTPEPVGFSPILNVSGNLGDFTDVEIRSKDNNQVLGTIKNSNVFNRHLEAPERLIITFRKSDAELSKILPALHFPIVIATPKLTALRNQQNSETQKPIHFFDFTDLIETTEAKKIPTHYRGLIWNNITAMHDRFLGGAGYQNTVLFGRSIAYTSSGQLGSISRDEPFTFESGYFGIAHANRDGEKIIIRAYRNDDLLYTDSFTLSAFYPTFFLANYTDITKITFETEFAWQVVLEGLTFRF